MRKTIENKDFRKRYSEDEDEDMLSGPRSAKLSFLSWKLSSQTASLLDFISAHISMSLQLQAMVGMTPSGLIISVSAV